VLSLDSTGRLVRWDVSHVAAWRVFVSPDSLFITPGAMIGGPVSMRAVAAPAGTFPWHDASGALLERLVQSRRASRAWQDAHVIALPWSLHVRTATLSPIGSDSVQVTLPEGTWRLAVDRQGHVLGGTSPDRRLVLTRVPWRTLASREPAAGHHTDAAHDVPQMSRVDSTTLMQGEEVQLRAHDGVTLAGTYTRPAPDRANGAAVLLLSGAGPQDRDLAIPSLPGYGLFRVLADTLVQRGYAVLRLDDRGAGRSGGVPYSATMAGEAQDARTALAWLRARPELRGARPVLIGHSDGGLIAAHVADDTTVSAVVLLGAPARTGRELARAQRRDLLAADARFFSADARASLLDRLDAEAERVARVDPWFADWLGHDAARLVQPSRVPALLVHGARDRQVDPSNAPALERILRGRTARDVQVHVVRNANHLLVADSVGDPRLYRTLPQLTPVPEALSHVGAWLDARVRGVKNGP
jgi:alpha-beta hydrolase superfamily lysophospholipase